MAAELQTSLLYRIMARMGEMRDVYPNWVTTPDMLSLVPETIASGGEQKALFRVDRHVEFLIQSGFLTSGTRAVSGHRAIQLTVVGQRFVQPELAGFGKEPLLPQVVKSIEDRIAVLTYPQEEKDTMRYRLREALTKQAPDLVAKVLAEIAYKAFTGGA